jgi:hypothetical protein
LKKEHAGVLALKLIDIDYIKSKNIQDPIDYFTPGNSDPQKILFRVNNSWVLADLCRDLFLIFENYEPLFGECLNKLKLMLDLGTTCFKLSFIFTSDGSFSERLKEDVLIKAGERKTLSLMEKDSIELPLSLANKEQLPMGKTNILEVLMLFSKVLLEEDMNYKRVWDKHLQGPECFVDYESNFIYHYSKRMAQIIQDDLKTKLEDLDLDKDPFQIGKLYLLIIFSGKSYRSPLVIRPYF